MKKIIKTILMGIIQTSLIFTFLQVKAETIKSLKSLVVVEGSNVNLELDDYTLVSSNLNKEPGVYYAYYQDGISNVRYQREIDVVREADLTAKGLNYNQNIQVGLCSKWLQKDYLDMVEFNGKVAYLYQDAKNDYKVLIDKNTSYVLSTRIYSENCHFYKIIYDEYTDYLYVLGDGYTPGSAYDIVMIKIDSDAKLVSEIHFGGNSPDYLTDAIYVDGIIYFNGITESNNKMFEHDSNGKDAFLFKYNLLTLDKTYYDLKGSFTDQISSLKQINQKIYTVVTSSDGKETESKLYEIGDDIKTLDLNIPSAVYYFDGVNYQDEIYLFYSYLNNDIYESTLSVLTNDYNLQILNEYYDTNLYGKLLIPSDNFVTLIYEEDDGKMSEYQIFNYNKIDIAGEIFFDANISHSLDNKTLNSYQYQMNGKIYTYQFHYLKENENNFFFWDNEIIKPLVKDESTEEIFGFYETKIMREFDDFSFVYNKSEEVKLMTNVKENNTYTVGLVITFNGEGYLNNEKISSGFIITSVGTQTLKVIGHKTDDVIITFKTIDLLTSHEILEEVPSIVITKLNSETPQEEMAINSENLTENLTTKNEFEKLWYLIVPALTFLSTLLYFNVVGRKS